MSFVSMQEDIEDRRSDSQWNLNSSFRCPQGPRLGGLSTGRPNAKEANNVEPSNHRNGVSKEVDDQRWSVIQRQLQDIKESMQRLEDKYRLLYRYSADQHDQMRMLRKRIRFLERRQSGRRRS